ncbi:MULTISPECIES: hypothetical protein [Yersinia pseudotuberculosis complex]|uniref:Uncharacterized protein n=1 Tax=Yersinia similis TaxID=367190 RepID=A0A0T9QM40_9GAMM|nr:MULTISPECIES: hypothetical protein [Yersinia pseudotuberculosis complex]AHK18101.1 hypothetical protein BF17_01020 [Yersinia similis]CFQ50816.1 Uncharacterised protein [Yersinia similis]CFV23327.1 Uncharacterised protein [Yersinia pseudotuberculosis]CNE79448.1 Uncharacterised protein [Yersinia similis]CNF15120.1 Uncharacterised protein [Yersinia similis]
MNVIKGRVFSEDSEKTKLDDLLKMVPENDWVWCVYEFTGIGEAPNDLSMPDFEHLVLLEEYGFPLSWQELKTLSASLVDMTDCLIAAVTEPVLYDAIDRGDFTHCLALIKFVDSTEWEVGLVDDVSVI